MVLLKFPFRKTYYEINDYFLYLLCLQKTTFPIKNTPKTRGKFVFLSHNLYIMVMESLKQNNIVIRRTNLASSHLKKENSNEKIPDCPDSGGSACCSYG